MLKIEFRKKIRKEITANHSQDIVFEADKVYCINKKENVMAIFNSHKDYLLDNAAEYTKTKDEFLCAMGKIWDALEDDKRVLKKFSKGIKDLRNKIRSFIS